MSFLRPDARALLLRWREVGAALAFVAFALWWAVTGLGITAWVGGAGVLAGLALVFGAVQRKRFARGGGGAGVVQIDERRISYFGPLTGGVVDLDELASLALDGDARPAHWRLRARDGTELAIPVDAERADALFDAFAALPGLRTEPLLGALANPAPQIVTLWIRDPGTVVRLPRR